MGKAEMKKHVVSFLCTMLDLGRLNCDFAEGLSDTEAKLYLDVEKQLSAELKQIFLNRKDEPK